MTDNQIIDLIRAGNSEKAFLLLYKHYAVIKKMILAKGGKAEDAEDIYQEALIIFHRKVSDTSFTLTAKASTYLYSICRFLWKDELKKRNKLNTVSFEDELDAAEENSLAEMLEKENKIKLAEQVIANLGDRCRELLILFYSGTMKLKEIAKKMGYATENATKNQKYKCLESAKLKLKALSH